MDGAMGQDNTDVIGAVVVSGWVERTRGGSGGAAGGGGSGGTSSMGDGSGETGPSLTEAEIGKMKRAEARNPEPATSSIGYNMRKEEGEAFDKQIHRRGGPGRDESANKNSIEAREEGAKKNDLHTLGEEKENNKTRGLGEGEGTEDDARGAAATA